MLISSSYNLFKNNFMPVQGQGLKFTGLLSCDTVSFGNRDSNASGKSIIEDSKHFEWVSEYLQELDKAFDSAQKHIESQIKDGKRGVVMLDIDGTVLADTWGQYLPENIMNYEDPDEFDRAVKEADLTRNSTKGYYPAIPRAKKFIQWLINNKIPYVFVTARANNVENRNNTIANLESEGLKDKEQCRKIYFYTRKDFDDNRTKFKQGLIEELDSEGLLAIIGNNPEDLRLMRKDDGEYKLPYVDNSKSDCFLIPNY